MEKRQLVEFISINHHLMTISEMVEETGSNFPMVKRICDNNGWVPITIPERVREFVHSHKHLSFEEQASKLDLTEQTLKYHYQNLGIPVPKKRDEKAQKEPVQDVTIKSPSRKPTDRKSITYYNQTGTDLLDSIHGIKTTARNDRLLI